MYSLSIVTGNLFHVIPISQVHRVAFVFMSLAKTRNKPPQKWHLDERKVMVYSSRDPGSKPFFSALKPTPPMETRLRIDQQHAGL